VEDEQNKSINSHCNLEKIGNFVQTLNRYMAIGISLNQVPQAFQLFFRKHLHL
jgi:hypothetical protein